MLILGLIVFGLAVGWVAQLILGEGRRGERNWGQALAAGLIGSLLGGLLLSLVAGDGLTLRPSGLLGSLVGAIIVVWVWDAIRRRKA
jgi:uncharacterized membrane protein YeaQ/YmgE (transglycosylase-associated protein family)